VRVIGIRAEDTGSLLQPEYGAAPAAGAGLAGLACSDASQIFCNPAAAGCHCTTFPGGTTWNSPA
jgi:hypothetical protein